MKKLLLIAFMLFLNNIFAQIPDAICESHTYTYNADLLDPGTLSGIMPIYEVGTLKNIIVTVDITHTYDSDIIISIESPSGKEVILSNRRGGGDDNYTSTIFDDNASTNISDGSAPFINTYKPDEPLNNLFNEDIEGDWLLKVYDVADPDTGKLISVTLDYCYYEYGTGPGGVGNTSSNILWLRPDDFSGMSDSDDILTWTDVSGNTNDVTESTTYSPIYKENMLNGYSSAKFNKDYNRIRKTNFNNFPTNAITSIFLSYAEDYNEGILSYASTSNANDFLLFDSDDLDIIINGDNNNFGTDFRNSSWDIVNVGWRNSDGYAESWLNGGFDDSINNIETNHTFTGNGCFAIGNDQDSIDGDYSNSQDFEGDFTEVILYNIFLNNAQNIIVSNYLSAKYDRTLALNDYYTQDDSSNGDFDFNVVGIVVRQQMVLIIQTQKVEVLFVLTHQVI